MIIGFRYEILYSKGGFRNNLQSYISGVRKVPIQKSITLTGTTNSDVDLQISFIHTLVLPSSLRTEGKRPLDFPPRIGSDLIAPVTID